MALTREEWIEMWKAIKEIERGWEMDAQVDWRNIKIIKDKIQQVIGQME